MPLATPPGYAAFNEASVLAFLDGIGELRDRLGGGPDSWSVVEVGDGNLNLVFLVDGPEGSLCVKQALPYVRAAGESWPLPLDRAFFEQAYYAAIAPHVEGLTPRVYHYEPALYAIVMETLSRLNRERGVTVIFVSHDPDDSRYAARIVQLRDGRLAAETEASG